MNSHRSISLVLHAAVSCRTMHVHLERHSFPACLWGLKLGRELGRKQRRGEQAQASGEALKVVVVVVGGQTELTLLREGSSCGSFWQSVAGYGYRAGVGMGGSNLPYTSCLLRVTVLYGYPMGSQQ